jgi:hypothetical protein
MTLSDVDRLAIHELLSLHGHLADDRRADELDRLFTEDAVLDLEDYGMGVVVGLAGISGLFRDAPGDQPAGHHVTNVIVTGEVDGTARVRSKGLAVMPDGHAGTTVYEDQVVRTPAGWRIAHRKIVRRVTRAAPAGQLGIRRGAVDHHRRTPGAVIAAAIARVPGARSAGWPG